MKFAVNTTRVVSTVKCIACTHHITHAQHAPAWLVSLHLTCRSPRPIYDTPGPECPAAVYSLLDQYRGMTYRAPSGRQPRLAPPMTHECLACLECPACPALVHEEERERERERERELHDYESIPRIKVHDAGGTGRRERDRERERERERVS